MIRSISDQGCTVGCALGPRQMKLELSITDTFARVDVRGLMRCTGIRGGGKTKIPPKNCTEGSILASSHVDLVRAIGTLLVTANQNLLLQ